MYKDKQKVAHGNIRPGNVFYDGIRVVLGPVSLPKWTIPPKNWTYRDEDYRRDKADLGTTFLSLLIDVPFDTVRTTPFSYEISEPAASFRNACFALSENRQIPNKAVSGLEKSDFDPESFYYFRVRDLFVYNPESGLTRSRLWQCPLGIGFACSYLSPSRMLLTGGTGTQSLAISLNLQDFSTSILSDLLSPHIHHGTTQYQDEIWVVGGVKSKTCEAWIQDREWIKKPNLTTIREKCVLTINKNTLFAIGGAEELIEKFEDGEWKALRVLFQIEGTFPVFLAESQLFLFGGKRESGYIETGLVLELSTGIVSSSPYPCTGLFGVNPPFVKDDSRLLFSSNIGRLYQFLIPEKTLMQLN